MDVFEVEILEIIDGLSDRMEIKKKLDEFEIYYIEHLNSYAPNGYNQTRGGDAGITGYKFTKEQRQHISEYLSYCIRCEGKSHRNTRELVGVGAINKR